MSRAGTLALLVLASLSSLAARAEPLHEAREHYERGTIHFNLGELDDAIGEFKASYESSRAPGLLYNLGQVYRLKKDPERAVYFYRAYLREAPAAPNRSDVEARIAELLSPAGVSVVAPATSRATQPGHALRASGIAALASGLALLAVGIGIGLDARASENSLDRGEWNDAARARWAGAQSESAAATALDILGGTSIGAGVLLYALGRRQAARAPRLAVAGGGLSWSF